MGEVDKYLKDVLDLICEKDDLDRIIYDISTFADKIGYGSIIGSEESRERKAFIESELKNISSETLREYFEIVLNNDDIKFFEPSIFKAFAEEFDVVARKTLFFHITTAITLKREDIQALSQSISNKMQRKAVLNLIVDSSILGGAIIKKDNYIFDFSLKTKLTKLGDEWKKSIRENEE